MDFFAWELRLTGFDIVKVVLNIKWQRSYSF